ncbi:MAG: hypothetical protein QOI69_824 [Pseudonocardiales bacterium]|jgi:hypothetical protein|nr:hypothetical protein [Pseudonocardiales bacterium]
MASARTLHLGVSRATLTPAAAAGAGSAAAIAINADLIEVDVRNAARLTEGATRPDPQTLGHDTR